MKKTIRKVTVETGLNEIRICYPMVSEMGYRHNLFAFWAVAVGMCIIPLIYGPISMLIVGFSGSSTQEDLLFCLYAFFFFTGLPLFVYVVFVRQFLLHRTLIMKPDRLILRDRELGWERQIFEIPRRDLPPVAMVTKYAHDQSTPGTSPHKLILHQKRKKIDLISDYPEAQIQLVRCLLDGYRADNTLPVIAATCLNASGAVCWLSKDQPDSLYGASAATPRKPRFSLPLYRVRQIGTAIFGLGLILWFGLWKIEPWGQMVGPCIILLYILWQFHLLRCPKCAIHIGRMGISRQMACPHCGAEIGAEERPLIPPAEDLKPWIILIGFPVMVVLVMILIFLVSAHGW